MTPEEVISWDPCYSDTRVVELFAGRASITALDVPSLDIPPEDRLWVVLREEVIPARTLHEFACACAEAALLGEVFAGRPVDPRSYEAIAVKRRWIAGCADDAELAAAWSAAQGAARAAWDAARAAGDAARAAAGDAARAAAGDAAWSAAGDAAWSATQDAQITYLRGALT